MTRRCWRSPLPLLALPFAAAAPTGSSAVQDPVFGYPVIGVCDLNHHSVTSCENTK